MVPGQRGPIRLEFALVRYQLLLNFGYMFRKRGDFAREISQRSYPQIGVVEAHHEISHHGNQPAKLEGKTKIDELHMTLLARLIDRMAATPDGDGSLLDHSLVLYGGGMGNGNLHRHTDLPCLLAGKLGGAFATGKHLAYPTNTPMTNLLLTILAASGIPQDKIGDSTGKLEPDFLSLG